MKPLDDHDQQLIVGHLAELRKHVAALVVEAELAARWLEHGPPEDGTVDQVIDILNSGQLRVRDQAVLVRGQLAHMQHLARRLFS